MSDRFDDDTDGFLEKLSIPDDLSVVGGARSLECGDVYEGDFSFTAVVLQADVEEGVAYVAASIG